MSHSSYKILAYYHFVPINNPEEEVLAHQTFFDSRDVASRIYISEQGINGQMSAATRDADDYMEWMLARRQFKGIPFKVHPYHEHVFPRRSVKSRKQLVAFDADVDLSNRGEHIPPHVWKEMLEKDDGHVLLDIRNDYEWQIGHFEGASLPPCETSRDFKQYTNNLKAKVDPKKTPVMMYCTGGIRCEMYSSILKENGFEKVYQLDGGIINYGMKEGNAHWLGKLFVFDDRLTIPLSDKESPTIGKCHHCDATNDAYYNCANMDCNRLFVCCPNCLDQFAGCCQEQCRNAPRLRPCHEQNAHKPFRKWHHYFEKKR